MWKENLLKLKEASAIPLKEYQETMGLSEKQMNYLFPKKEKRKKENNKRENVCGKKI